MKNLTFTQRRKQERRKKMIAAALSLSVIGGAVGAATPRAGAVDSAVKLAENSVAAVECALTTRAYIPAGAKEIDLIVNDRHVLDGRAFYMNGSTYVPMFAFADWLGNFEYSYNAWTKTAKICGENLEINATAGRLYISANGRYFYTENEVLLHNGAVYVPILPMVKALNGYVSFDSEKGAFVVRSGDTRKLRIGTNFYRDDEVYWLARIISAEAGAEPLKGKIAVGNVVLNRVRSEHFPNTIYGVIFDRKFGVQFSPVANGTIYKEPTAESIIAAKICLEGYMLSEDILYFMNPDIATSSWISNNRPVAFRIGNHVFYD